MSCLHGLCGVVCWTVIIAETTVAYIWGPVFLMWKGRYIGHFRSFGKALNVEHCMIVFKIA